LRTLRHPVIDAGIVKAQFFFLATSLGIVETNALDVTAISRAAAIAYHDVEKRPPLGAAASQSN
jgi:hypothetical protein